MSASHRGISLERSCSPGATLAALLLLLGLVRTDRTDTQGASSWQTSQGNTMPVNVESKLTKAYVVHVPIQQPREQPQQFSTRGRDTQSTSAQSLAVFRSPASQQGWFRRRRRRKYFIRN